MSWGESEVIFRKIKQYFVESAVLALGAKLVIGLEFSEVWALTSNVLLTYYILVLCPNYIYIYLIFFLQVVYVIVTSTISSSVWQLNT